MQIQKVNLYQDAARAIEAMLAGKELEGVQTWTEAEVMLAVAVGMAFERNTRLRLIAAKALASLPGEVQTRLLETREISLAIREEDATQAWPMPTTPEAEGFDLDAYKRRMMIRLNQHAEAQSHRLFFGGDRLAHTYRKKEAEAAIVLAAADPDALAPDAIPYVHFEALELGLSRAEVAMAIDKEAQVATAWDSEHCEPARQTARRAIATATTTEDVEAAYRTAATRISASMDTLLATLAAAG